jgi:hypothetical protein
VSLDGSSVKIPWVLRKVVAPIVYHLGRRIAKGKMKAGISSAPEYIPSPTVDEAEAIQHLEQAIARFENHQGDFREHPFFGRFSAEQWREYQLIHCAHHLSFLVPPLPVLL